MKKDKKSCDGDWKSRLWEGCMELLLLLGAGAIGFGVALLFPHETVKNIPYELFFLLGGAILFAIILIVALIVHLIKKKQK